MMMSVVCSSQTYKRYINDYFEDKMRFTRNKVEKCLDKAILKWEARRDSTYETVPSPVALTIRVLQDMRKELFSRRLEIDI